MSSALPPPSPIYYTAKGWRIFMYAVSPVMIVVFLALPFLGNATDSDHWSVVFMSVLGVGMAGVFLYGLFETAKWHFTIGPESFETVGLFKTKTLAREEVAGYRVNEHYIFIVPQDTKASTIKVGYTTERYADIQEWLADHYPNLDEVEAVEAAEEALIDEELGRNPDERSERLVHASTTAKYLNIVAWAVTAWLFFYPQPYQLAIGAGLLLPLLGAVGLKLHRGALRINEEKNSPYPSVSITLFMPCMGLLIRSVLDVDLVSYTPMWIVAGQTASVTAVVLAFCTHEWLFQSKVKFTEGAALIAAAAVYGYSASATFNAAFDDTQGQVFSTEVLSKSMSSGKTTTYHLTVAPWGPFTTETDVQVGSNYYQATRSGDKVRVRLQPGRLGVPWFEAD
ncbi:hypothetical protein [Hymenobacter glacialis]|nr:hypothetical protein [Hymenobacter glacialis]